MNMDTYMFGNWRPIVPIKLSQNQGALHFHNLTDMSTLLSLCLRVGKLPHKLISLLK